MIKSNSEPDSIVAINLDKTEQPKYESLKIKLNFLEYVITENDILHNIKS